MITSSAEKKLLQVMVALACLVPLSAGLGGAWRGIGPGNAIALDSHFRYLSGLLLGIASFFSALSRILNGMARLTFIVIIGGLSRLLGIISKRQSGRCHAGGTGDGTGGHAAALCLATAAGAPLCHAGRSGNGQAPELNIALLFNFYGGYLARFYYLIAR